MFHPALKAQLNHLGLDETTPPTSKVWRQLLTNFNHVLATSDETSKAIQYHIKFEHLITSISTYFINLTSHEVDAAIIRALRQVGEFVEVDHSYVFLLSDDGKTISSTHEWYSLDADAQIDSLQNFSVEAISWQLEQLTQFKIVHVEHTANLPSTAQAEIQLLKKQSVQSLLIVPLVYSHTLMGFLGFDTIHHKKSWDEEDIALLRIVGEIFVSALHRRHTEAQLSQQTSEIAALYRASTQLFATANLQGLAEQIARTVTSELAFLDCSVLLLDQPITLLQEWPAHEQRTILRLAQSGRYRHKSAFQISLDGPGLIPSTIRTGEAIYCPDVRQDERYLQGDSETRSELVVPLKVNNLVIGALDIQSPKLNAIDERSRRLINVYAEHAGLALENARLYQELQKRTQELEQQISERTEVEAQLRQKTAELLAAQKTADSAFVVKYLVPHSDWPIDMKAVRKIMGPDMKKLLPEMLTIFFKESDKLINNILETSATGNTGWLKKHLHALKGTSASVGMKSLATLCKSLEKSCLIASFDDNLLAAQEISQEYQKIKKALYV